MIGTNFNHRYRVDPEHPAPRKVQPTIESLRHGGVIIYPTDTGYAFGCALSSAKGILTLRRLKGIHEKHWKPLSMLVGSFNEIGRYGHMDTQTFRLMRRLLPGTYTFVLRCTKEVPRAMQTGTTRWGCGSRTIPSARCSWSCSGSRFSPDR